MKFLKAASFLTALFFLLSMQNQLSAEKGNYTCTSNVQKKGTIAHVYKFSEKEGSETFQWGYYVLEDGYSLYQFGNNWWCKGDSLEINWHFDMEGEVEYAKVINKSTGKKKKLSQGGFTSVEPYFITDKKIKKINDGKYIVSIFLNEGSICKIYCEHCFAPFSACSWEIGERVALFIKTDENQQDTMFPVSKYSISWSYGLINLDSKQHRPGVVYNIRMGKMSYNSLSASSPHFFD